MTPEQFKRIEELFHRAKDLAPDVRRALLDAAGGDDAEVRAEVEKLLAMSDPEATLQDLEKEIVRIMGPGSGDDAVGPAIEGYDILREIHRGGQGVVYQAIQKSTKRKVAIKVLLEGPYASKSAKRRFEREIELVAQLKHPNIIAIFHSGQTTDGRQYCVMDYVRGVPLDQYVRNEKLTLEEALQLFSTVCEAVNYAHQRGVIHRDLKPSNILVTPPLQTPPLQTPPLKKWGAGGVGLGRVGPKRGATGSLPASVGDPKVLDFGLAKQLLSPDESLVSLTGQVIGTLPYMSPEQAEGNPDKIDIRTDVYALGVILYQMLTGHYPYPVAGQMAEVLKHIAETPPTPPSRSWKSDSGITRRTTKRLRPGQCPIDDEVQTIVLRTLAKERERRYQSAGELAKDVSHYLAGEPIDAKRDSAFYVLKKHMRRYRLPITFAAMFVVLITVSLVVSFSLWRQAERNRATAVLAQQEQSRARQEAEDALKREAAARAAAVAAKDAEARERVKAEKINEFVTKSLVSSDPNQGGAQGFLVTDAMVQAVALLDAGELKGQPETEAALWLTMSHILNGNARSAEALRLARRALEINEQLHASDHPAVAEGLNNVALCLDSLGRSAEALPKFEAALAMRQRLFEGDHPTIATSLNNVAGCLNSLGRSAEALPKFEAALQMYQRLFEGDHPRVALGLNNVAACLNSLGRSAKALPKYEAALEMYQRLFEGDHPNVAMSMDNVAKCLQSLGRSAEALAQQEAALEMRQRLFQGDHPDVALGLNNVAGCLDSLGRSAEALAQYEAALEMFQRLFEGDHPAVASSLNNVAYCLRSLGRSAEALPKFEAALEMYRRVLPPGHPHTLYSQRGLAKTLVSLGRHAEAEPLLLDAAEQCERSDASRRMHWRSVVKALVGLYDAWHLAEPDADLDSTGGTPVPQKAAAWRAKLPAGERAGSLIKLGMRLLEAGRHAEAEVPLSECLEIRQEALPEGHWLIFNTMSVLGEALAGQGTERSLTVEARIEKLREAQPLLLDGYAKLNENAQAIPQAVRALRLRQALERIVDLYDAWHAAEPDANLDSTGGTPVLQKAAAWRAKLAATSQPATQQTSQPTATAPSRTEAEP